MATCIVTGILTDLSGTAIANAVIRANLVTPVFFGTSQVVPKEIITTPNVSGVWTLTITQGAQAIVTIEYPPNTTDSRRLLTYTITVPATPTADFSSLATEL